MTGGRGPRLPPLARGRRRALLAGLVALALAHTACALGVALGVGALLATAAPPLPLVCAVAGALAGMGVTRALERSVAERMGQDYVHELRAGIVASAFDAERPPSLGITIARSTNDLTAIRSWVSQGIAPLIAAAALAVGSLALLAVLHVALVLAAALPLAALAAVVVPVGRLAFARARRVRRLRGRLAARVSDTLHAREGIVAGGGTARELRRVDADSRAVADAAVARARVAGVLDGAAVAASASVAILLVVVGQSTGATSAAIATGLTLAGVLAGSLAGLGRLVELRQNDRAARRILGPLFDVDRSPVVRRGARTAERLPAGRGLIAVSGLPGGAAFAGRVGERIRLVGGDAATLSALLRSLSAPAADGGPTVVVDGWDHGLLPVERRRELVGLAAAGVPFERGTIARAVRYRRPDLPSSSVDRAIVSVGLSGSVRALHRGARTELRRGGDPLPAQALGLLRLARATFGEPPLLLLDRLDGELDEAGCQTLRRTVDDYPGLVVFTSDAPDRVASRFREVALG